MSNASQPAVVVIVGAGPRGTGLLERLCANAPELFGDRRLEIHLVDPHPFGAGQIWRSEQSALLWANSLAVDMTMFTDELCTIDGPVFPGPTMAEWARDSRPTPIRRAELNTEMMDVGVQSFPTRRLVNEYLAWTFWRIVQAAPPSVQIFVHPERVLDLTDAPDARQHVHLEHRTLVADAVLVAIGHLPTEALGPSIDLAAFAEQHGLTYLPENYAADADLSIFRPGENVLVKGFGLAFIDLMVLLTEGRGGRYASLPDGRLRYRPSGQEPHLFVGSRRGVPYRSKITYSLQGGPAPHPRFLTPAAVDGLLGSPEPIDFQAAVWPLLLKELVFGYYHELWHAHPSRVRLPWNEFEAALAAGSTVDDPAFRALVDDVIPDPADRFDLATLDRPLRGLSFPDADTLQQAVHEHIAADLARHADPRFSADQGTFLALLAVLAPLSRLMNSGQMAVGSLLRDVPTFLSLFSYLASGPPPQRLRELLALADAGLVTFLGADLEVKPVEDGPDAADGAGFVASSSSAPGEVWTRALIEARLPRPSLARGTDPLIRALFARGELGEQELLDPDTGNAVPTGRLQVTSDYRMVDAAGRAHPRRYAFGAWTSAATPAAFSRPRTNAAFFQQNDAAARGLLEVLRPGLGSGVESGVESGLGHETAFTDGPEPIGDDDSAQLRSSARPGSFEVRAVTEDDPDLARMLRELEREYSARYGAAGDELARYPSSRFHPPEGESLLLFEDGVCVAGGAFIHLDDETVELKRIWTDRSRRGRGLARRLLTALETAAAERGYRRVFLTTGPRQPEARALYLATGYTPLFDLTADPEWVGPLPFEKKLQAP